MRLGLCNISLEKKGLRVPDFLSVYVIGFTFMPFEWRSSRRLGTVTIGTAMIPHLKFIPRTHWPKAQQKMQRAVGSTNNNKIEKVSNERRCSLSRKPVEQQNFKSPSKDNEVSALIWMNSDQRYFILISLEPDAHWRLLAPFLLPQDPAQRVDLISSPSAIAHPMDTQEALWNHAPDLRCSAESVSASSSFGSNVSGQLRYRALVNRRTKVGKDSGISQKNSFISTDSSSMIHDGSSASSSADQVKDTCKADKPVKRSSKRKAKKKKKKPSKRSSSGTNSIGQNAFCEEGVHGSSVSETCANSNLARSDGLMSENELSVNAMPPAVLLQEVTVEETDGVKNTNCITNNPATPKSVQPYYDGLIAPETAVALTPEDFTGDNFLVTFAKETQTTDPVASTTNEVLANIHQKQANYRNEISSEVFSDAHHVRMLDSVSDEWNSDDSTNAGDDVDEQSVKEDNIVTPPESYGYANCGFSSHGPGKGYFSYGDSSECVADDDNYSERAKCNSRDCSSSIFHSVSPDKTGRQGRKLSGNSGGIRKFSSGGNAPVRMGKENNISVWQKVRKNNGDECTCDSNAAPVGSQSNIASKEAPFSKRVSKVVDADVSMKSNDDRNSKVKVSENMKKKPSAGAKKQESNYYSKKGLHSNKTNSGRVAKMNMQEKEVSEISTQVNHHLGFSTGTNSHSYIDCPKVENQTKAVDCSPDKISIAEVCLDERKAPESVCTAVSSVSCKSALNKSSSSSRTSELLDQAHSLSDGSAKLETEVCHTEYGNQDHNSGSVMQMWMPVVKKDVADETVTNRSNSTLVTCLDEPAAGGLAVKNIDKKELGSNSHNFVPVTDAVVASAVPSSCNAKFSPPSEGMQVEKSNFHLPAKECSFVPVTDAVVASAVPSSCDAKFSPPSEGMQVEKSNSNNTCTTKENDRDHSVPYSVVTHEPIDQNILNKITEAVRDAYRIEMNSKGVELATGNPLAEFERLLYSASPVLRQRDHFQHCRSCSRDDVIGASLCRHEIRDISLANLWQWYEKHGSYGLEIRAEDYQNYKRMGIDRFSFRAYFVPFLSAVQLFGSSRSRSTNFSNRRPSVEIMKACHLPIFSLLLPQPCKRNTELAPLNPLYTSRSSSVSSKDEFTDHSLSMTSVEDSELLFEYFESDQPQQRRPLFEKIKELVRGDGLTNGKGYGDPKKLESMDLHDLHPASWYSVAWYPIYRIPDGHFRASFLTYHSLGHLIQKGTSSDCPGGGCSVVSPVVGLESYNTQAECWFQLRPSGVTRTEASSHMNRSELLKERLRTLEKTASVMARAEVIKEKVKSANRQPDYEFFVSRRRRW